MVRINKNSGSVSPEMGSGAERRSPSPSSSLHEHIFVAPSKSSKSLENRLKLIEKSDIKHKLGIITRLVQIISHFWIRLWSPEKAVLKRVGELAGEKETQIQAKLEKEFPSLDPLVHRDAAKAYLLHYLNRAELRKELPEIIENVKAELNHQFPGLRGEFNESYILNEIKENIPALKSDSLKREYLAFAYGKMIAKGKIEGSVDSILKLNKNPATQAIAKIRLEGLLQAFEYDQRDSTALLFFSLSKRLEKHPDLKAVLDEKVEEFSSGFKKALNQISTVELQLESGNFKEEYCTAEDAERGVSFEIVNFFAQEGNVDKELKAKAQSALGEIMKGAFGEMTFGASDQVPGDNRTLKEGVIQYSESAGPGQGKRDFNRNPRMLIDGIYESHPSYEDLGPKVATKYGPIAERYLTQGMFDTAQKMIVNQLNPNFFSKGDFGKFMVSGQNHMTYVVEEKEGKVYITYKICYDIREQNDPEKLLYYIPAEQTVSFYKATLKSGELNPNQIETTVKLHAPAPILRAGYKALNMPALNASNAPKFMEDLVKAAAKDKLPKEEGEKATKAETLMDTTISLLVERGLSGAEDLDEVTLPNIKAFLEAMPKNTAKERRFYQTFKGKLEEALSKG